MVTTSNNSNDNLEKKFNDAVVHHRAGEFNKACRLYEDILEIMPGSSLVRYNLGLALFESGRYRQAYEQYSKVLEHAPEEVDVLYNYALCARKMGKHAETVAAYHKILTITPNDTDSLYNLGCCHGAANEDRKAIEAYHAVLKKDENHAGALNNIAYMYHKNGNFENAEKYYSRLLKVKPDHQAATHLLASLRGEKLSHAPAHYVEWVFDHYAERYDTSLVGELEYDVPNILRQSLNECIPANETSLTTLDLGCGTGLGGEAFHDICSTLTGIDISSGMLEKAADKDIYSSLHLEDILQFLQRCTGRYDLLLALDVFTYLGELNQIFSALSQVSHPGAWLCFSTEKTSDDDYCLLRSGRFAHSPAYIDELCESNGWSVITKKTDNIRRERGQWVDGSLIIARFSAG